MSVSIKYLQEIILACAFTSVSIHLLNQRRDVQAEQLRYSAQVGALEDVVQRLRAGELVSDAELGKIRRRVDLLKREGTVANPKSVEQKESIVKRPEPTKTVSDEQIFSEWNKAMKEASEEPARSPSLLRALFSSPTINQDNVLNKERLDTSSDTRGQTTAQHGQTAKKPIFY
ncbi:hypothetical protein M408DRAFT_21431 [Serendipita vermifera MAFF 305830]|uniref:Uncharacterized protein n=1 Tax=Serendipita vermifera MAFF 305830 TaxID=933852 RepID=A0A0C3BIP6_SERVB|nr:hypothetical protein M408DRAFT_21431 [Serendipita vermifera MAFF 305830]